jgi:hypothetical protein
MVPGSAPGGGDGRGLLGRGDPRRALEEFARSTDPFDEWLKERGREVYHFESGQTLQADEEVFEAEVG